MDINTADWPIKTDPVDIPAKPTGLWTPVLEYVRGPALISFKAEGKWQYRDRGECGPDGDLLSMISNQQTLLAGAPVAALIGKIGGSTAGQSDGKVFLVGSFFVLEIDQTVRGPLYLTINDETTGMGNNGGDLKVTVALKPLPQGSGSSGPVSGGSTPASAPASPVPQTPTQPVAAAKAGGAG